MTREEVLNQLNEMRRCVVRELPHVGCKPDKIFHLNRPCNCYKKHLISALDDALRMVGCEEGEDPRGVFNGFAVPIFKPADLVEQERNLAKMMRHAIPQPIKEETNGKG